MNDVTLVYTVRNNYAIFRLALESALEYLPKEDYEEFIVVDDHSDDPKTIEFLKSINDDESIPVRVINAGEPLKYGYYNNIGRGSKGIKKVTGKDIKTSLGHGESINLGLDQVKTKYVCTIDSDSLILPKGKDILKNMIECMKLDDKILVVGQCSGKVDGIKVLEGNNDPDYFLSRGRPLKGAARLPGGLGAPFLYKKDGVNWNGVGGFPPAGFMLCDMRAWNEYKLSGFSNAGWAQAPFMYTLFRHPDKLKVCNYNAFKDGYVLHLGYSSVRLSRRAFQNTLGFVKNAGRYGSATGGYKNLYDWYAGYCFLSVDQEELFEILENEYGNFPYNERKSIVHKLISKELGGELESDGIEITGG